MPTLKRTYVMLFALAIIATIVGLLSGGAAIILGAIYLTGAMLAYGMAKDFENLLP